MELSVHRFCVGEARRVKHPIFRNLEKHYFTVRASDMPAGISTDPNARDPEGLNRTVYRDVKNSLLCENSTPGSFDLMNKGITILAEHVQRIDDQTYDIGIRKGQGIVDGGHTYRLICETKEHTAIPSEQYVEIQVRTGVPNDLITDIARGLNTGIQVQAHSLANLGHMFDWMKKLLEKEPYYGLIAWKESDEGEYDVRDLICVLESLNVFDFPNDSGVHPIHAYEKWSKATKNFIDDAQTNEKSLAKSKYYRLGTGLLKDALFLYDRIRRDFRDIHNVQGGRAGKLNIIDEASQKGGAFSFPFAQLQSSQYRLTKGALYPIFAAFRNAVTVSNRGTKVGWYTSFDKVLNLWSDSGPELVRETMNAVRELGSIPDRIGKSRGHWANLHRLVEIRRLREQLASV